MSTHVVHPPGVAALEALGPARAARRHRVPAGRAYSFDFGPVTIAGAPQPADGAARVLPAPDRAGQAAGRRGREAGAEVREGFTVDEM